MKTNVSVLLISLLSVFYCDAQIENKFSSKIRPDQTDLKAGETYINVLKFIEFDDNYDYAFSVFETEAGETVTLYHTEQIEDKYKDKLLRVKLDFYIYSRAGEGEEKYYHERLISFEINK